MQPTGVGRAPRPHFPLNQEEIVADINVERRSGPAPWVWIVALLVLALIAWLIISMMSRDDQVVTTDTVTHPVTEEPVTAQAVLPAQAEAFQRDCYLDEGQRVEDMGLDHSFTVNCMRQLADAIEAVAAQHGQQQAVTQHTQVMRDRMEQVDRSPTESVQHANWTRDAAQAGASALETLEQQAGTTGAAAQTRQAAQRFDTGQQQMEQLTHLRSYFRNAGQALQQLAGAHAI
jgi:hypothetical protein